MKITDHCCVLSFTANATSMARKRTERAAVGDNNEESPNRKRPRAETPAPCGFTQEKLITLTERIKARKVDYETYFFKRSSNTEHAVQLGILFGIAANDLFDRCNDCGRKKSEHNSASGTTGPVLVEDGTWPSLYPPPLEESKPTTLLKFLETKDGKWCFETNVPMRMVRLTEYLALWKALIVVMAEPKRRKGLLIVGHPGIGKTLALDVLLSWNLHEYPKMPVIVVTVEIIEVFLSFPCAAGLTPKRFSVNRTCSGSTLRQLLLDVGVARESEILVLHDVKTTESLPYRSELLGNLARGFGVTCVVAASPKAGTYKEYVKDVMPQWFVLPTLSLAEAQEFLRVHEPSISEEEIEKRFDSVGGVLRYICSSKAVESAVSAQNLYVRSLKFDPGCTPSTSGSDDNSSMLVRPLPSADRSRIECFDFVSDHARRLWAAGQDARSLSHLLNRLRMATNELTRDVVGRFFEAWFIALLKTKPQLRLQTFGHKAPSKKWSIPAMDETDLWGDSTDRVVATKGVALYVPRNSNFPVDAIIVTPDTAPNRGMPRGNFLSEAPIRRQLRHRKDALDIWH